MQFRDRQEAGRLLAEKLKHYQGKDVVVYALPRGGVITGIEVARVLHAPLDLLIPRKIGHPYNPEYAIAAVTETGEVVKNEAEVAKVDSAWFAEEVVRQREEAQRRRERYLHDRAPLDVTEKIAIVVDDGIATGLTTRAALDELRKRSPAKIVVATPVAPPSTVDELREHVDEVVIVHVPDYFFGAIGSYYQSFDQVNDEEVETLMNLNYAETTH